MKRSRILPYSALVLGLATLVGVLGNSSAIKADSSWKQLGKGNLESVQRDGKWYLHATPTTYIQMFGQQGKHYGLGTPAAYELDSADLSVTTPKKMTVQQDIVKDKSGKKQGHVLKAGGKVFNAEESRQQQLADGRFFYSDEDHENIFAVDDQGQVENLLDDSGLDSAKQLIKQYRGEGEEKGFLVWAERPIAAGKDNRVMFMTNRDSIKTKRKDVSVYVADKNDHKGKVLFDAAKYNSSVVAVGAAGDNMVGYVEETNQLVVKNVATNEEKVFDFNGLPDSISPDGKHVLFRKVDNHLVQREFYLLDITTGNEVKVDMPEHYFYNMVGAWSPDGSQFAFYLNGDVDNEKTVSYTTNVKVAVVNVNDASMKVIDKPQDVKGTLYPLGAISWLGNDTVVTYATDDTAWAVKVK